MTSISKTFRIRKIFSVENMKNVFVFFIIVLVFISIKPDATMIGKSGKKNDEVYSISSTNKLASFTVYNAISINQNSGFVSCGCTSSGNGSIQNPYVIQNLFINNNASIGIKITNTNAYFRIINVWVNGSQNDGFYFQNVSNAF